MSNTTSPVSNTSQPAVVWSNVHRVVYTLGVLCVSWAITANTIILVCFYRTRSRQWTSFIRQTCSMAISDLLVGFSAIPFLVLEHSESTMNGVVCFVTYYMFFATQCVTLFHVLCICILRNIKIKSVAQQNGTYNEQSAIKVIAPAWIFSLLIIMIPFALWGEPSNTDMLCSIDFIFGNDLNQAKTYLCVTYISSQCFTNLLYMITCFRFWRVTKKIAPIQTSTSSIQVASTSTNTTRFTNTTRLNTTSTRDEQKQRHTNTGQVTTIVIGKFRTGFNTEQPTTSETPGMTSLMVAQRRVISTIGILLLLFNVFTLPLTVNFFLEQPRKPRRDLRFIIVSLFLVNSAINPIVYATRVTALRDAVVQLFKDMFCFCF